MDFYLILKFIIIFIIISFNMFMRKRINKNHFNYFVLTLQIITLFLFFTNTFYRMDISLFIFDVLFWSMTLLGIVCLKDSIKAVSRLSFFNIPVTFIFILLLSYFLGNYWSFIKMTIWLTSVALKSLLFHGLKKTFILALGWLFPCGGRSHFVAAQTGVKKRWMRWRLACRRFAHPCWAHDKLLFLSIRYLATLMLVALYKQRSTVDFYRYLIKKKREFPVTWFPLKGCLPADDSSNMSKYNLSKFWLSEIDFSLE